MFLRVAAGMPTGHRREFVQKRAREEFKRNHALVDPTEQARLYQFGLTMLEQADVQRKHLTQCKQDNLLDCELTPEEKAGKRASGLSQSR
jgi:hypothetical protein